MKEEKPVWWFSSAVPGLEAKVGLVCQLGLQKRVSLLYRIYK